MFYRFNFYEEKELLKVKIYGKADLPGMRSRLALLANDHRWKSEYKLLIDYSNVTVIDEPKEFCNRLAELLSEIPEERLPSGIAYIFPDRLFCQCFDTTQDVHCIEAGCKISFFKQEEAAVEWLEKRASASVETGKSS
jgi:hypothetical protein